MSPTPASLMASIRLKDLSPEAQARYAEQLAPSAPQRRPAVTKRAKATDGRSELEASLLGQLRIAGLPKPETQVLVAPPRRWRWDGAWPDRMLAYEIQGATWAQGKHTRHDGYAIDCEKANEGLLVGWRCLRFDADMVNDGRALRWIEQALAKEADDQRTRWRDERVRNAIENVRREAERERR